MFRPALIKASPKSVPTFSIHFRNLASSAKDSTKPSEAPSKDDNALAQNAQSTQDQQKSTMSQAEKDQELMRKLAGISGEGGEAGIEYEDGKPVAMKRGVKNNMFRLI